MTTFDQILPRVTEVLNAHLDAVANLDWLLINRDLNGRVRLIVPESIEAVEAVEAVRGQVGTLAKELGHHAYPADATILYEASRELACQGATSHLLEGFNHVWLVDRLATEGNWAQIAPETQGPRRVVFFSIKGGVGRSTALAATAWTLAQARKRVLVADLDLESPGPSSSLLPPERQPIFGITDWLVEDLVDNADAAFDNMIATSDLSHDGDIFVVPAHGADPGEYVSKLGRVWMPKARPDGSHESWSGRLQRLLNKLEARVQPDVVLIDSRAGIDEVPYTWSVSHLADGRGQTSPRSFLAAIRQAAEDSSERPSPHEFALHYESIKRGIQQASEIRVQEVAEDYPWVPDVLSELKGMNVPCDYNDVQTRWQVRFPKGPQSISSDRLPAQHAERGWDGLRDDLQRLGLIETKRDGRIDMPDLYRVGFGLGRKGGVKPRH